MYLDEVLCCSRGSLIPITLVATLFFQRRRRFSLELNGKNTFFFSFSPYPFDGKTSAFKQAPLTSIVLILSFDIFFFLCWRIAIWFARCYWIRSRMKFRKYKTRESRSQMMCEFDVFHVIWNIMNLSSFQCSE